MRSSWPALAVFVLVSCLAELILAFGWIPAYLVPRPSVVLTVLVQDFSELWGAFRDTTVAAVGGFVISGCVGLVSALLIQRFPLVDRALYPYAVFFQTVPIIAIAPLLVIWIGFGLSTVIAASAIVCIFPIISNTLDGFRSANASLLDLFRLYRASERDVLLRLRLPSAVPAIFSGLRVSAGLAVIGAIVGEFVAGGGIGGLVDIARTQQRVDKVFAAILMGAGLGLALVKAVDFGRYIFTRRGYNVAQ
ncbi:MAG: ABC transporter permease [Deltaproteobacteria bacterium]|nr:ABC transporter permease [Deltaproteobacteria bacterium]MBI3295374.1 ABC transporter permease [Deltaproteobacteria bacterium]